MSHHFTRRVAAALLVAALCGVAVLTRARVASQDKNDKQKPGVKVEAGKQQDGSKTPSGVKRIPLITELETPAGEVNGSPGIAQGDSLTIVGKNFSPVKTQNTIILEGDFPDIPQSRTGDSGKPGPPPNRLNPRLALKPSSATSSTITVQIPATLPTNKYLVQVEVQNNGRSSSRALLVSDGSALFQLSAPFATTGQLVTMYGKLAPGGMKVVFEPQGWTYEGAEVMPGSVVVNMDGAQCPPNGLWTPESPCTFRFHVPNDMKVGDYRISVASDFFRHRTNRLALKVLGNAP